MGIAGGQSSARQLVSEDRTMSRREFQFVEGSSNKFWAISLNGNRFVVQWGRTGTSGQEQTKEFTTDAEAKKQYDKLVAEKLKKGYVEVTGSPGSGAAGEKATASPASMVEAARKS